MRILTLSNSLTRLPVLLAQIKVEMANTNQEPKLDEYFIFCIGLIKSSKNLSINLTSQ